MSTSIRAQCRSSACPNCGSDVMLVGRLMIGEVFGCQTCTTQLEVASTDPLALEPLAKVEEDEADLEG